MIVEGLPCADVVGVCFSDSVTAVLETELLETGASATDEAEDAVVDAVDESLLLQPVATRTTAPSPATTAIARRCAAFVMFPAFTGLPAWRMSFSKRRQVTCALLAPDSIGLPESGLDRRTRTHRTTGPGVCCLIGSAGPEPHG
ncbi:hypothetical protein GCM10023217_21000 [Gordonia alkaliphila]|uniref:Uncharacterized protein n=1 Tax=Gordonia alkaliphila TaxID=1053547 RepID=A0ABP8ZAH8_9ACTN